jgi:hypothetical protein
VPNVPEHSRRFVKHPTQLRSQLEGCVTHHGKKALLGVLELEVLIRELLSVDGLAASSVTVGEVTTLDHELLDNAVEGGSLVSVTVLAGRQLTAQYQLVDSGVRIDVVRTGSSRLSVKVVSQSRKWIVGWSCVPWGQYHRTDRSRCGQASHRHAQCRSKPFTHVSLIHLHTLPLRHTLWVILGPLTASVDCAKNMKVMDRISSAEMTIRWKENMMSGCLPSIGGVGFLRATGCPLGG